MDAEIDGRKVSELRVIDLKAELEKRGLEKVGIKSVLIQRLAYAVNRESTSTPSNSTPPTENFFQVEECEADDSQDDTSTAGGLDSSQSLEENASAVPDFVSPTSVKESTNESDGTTENKMNSSQGSDDLPTIKLSSKIFEDQSEFQLTGGEDEKQFGQVHKVDRIADLKDVETDGNSCIPVIHKVVEDDRTCTVDKVDIGKNYTPEIVDRDVDNLVIDEEKSCTTEIADVAADDVNKNTDSNIVSQTNSTTVQANSNTESVSTEKEYVVIGLDEDLEETHSEGVKSQSSRSSKETRTSSSKSKSNEGVRKRGGSSNASSSSKTKPQTLIVTGLASTARASDIKHAFRCFGKISGVKIISNTRSHGSTRFAHITIATNDDAATCIDSLNDSELFGHKITVSKTDGDALCFVKQLNSKVGGSKAGTEIVSTSIIDQAQVEAATAQSTDQPESENTRTDGALVVDSNEGNEKLDSTGTTQEPQVQDEKITETTKVDSSTTKVDSSTVVLERKIDDKKSNKDDAKHHRDDTRSRRPGRDEMPHRSSFNRRLEIRPHSPVRRRAEGGRTYYSSRPFRGRRGGPDRSEQRLTFEKIRRTREEAVRRDFERKRRDFHLTRQREEEDRQRSIQRRNQIELRELEEERERLRYEREKVERDKQELIRLEKLRQQHERERIEKEKIELRRAQLKLSQKRALGSEKEHGRFGDYPEVKKPYVVESHRVVPSSHSVAAQEFMKRPDIRADSSRRPESTRHGRDAMQGGDLELNDPRIRARARDREYSRRSTSRDNRTFPGAREKISEYQVPRTAPKSPERASSSRSFDRKEFYSHSATSRPETYRSAPSAGAESWGRNSYGTSGLSSTPTRGQSGRGDWSASRKSGSAVERTQTVRAVSDMPVERWPTTGVVGGYSNMSRTSPSLLQQHVFNPHAPLGASGAAATGSGYPSNEFDNYKPGAQHRRY